ncbi:AbrB/MazE/SpoVT family DNA-binding domain-containing protein [Thermosulfurimonas sp.]|uniref:AbrB/MazE/SpoVT family DNA-binding domain-containing protein n=1 Tax=Thermosulfurimonas sp. TaxID=2080236 RepID=UPI0025DB6673|nr:AbrB/MazE/SpoVT family DNA-binding domain-containing protein [Thermosulfurimonas sp.]
MVVKTVKVSRKGQITLPKKIREALGSGVLRLILEDRRVIIEPVEDLAGSLKKYAQPQRELSKEEVWAEVVREKFGGSSGH